MINADICDASGFKSIPSQYISRVYIKTKTKCRETRGTLFHFIWQCIKINVFWQEVRVIIDRIISKQIFLQPKHFSWVIDAEGIQDALFSAMKTNLPS